MSEQDTTPTQPSVRAAEATDPSKTTTQPEMPAVTPPPNTETRLKSVEDRLGAVESRVGDLETRAAAISSRVDDGDRKREAIAADVATLKTDMADVKAETKEQTAILQRIESAVTGILANPRVRALGWALLFAVTTWLASKGIKVPQ